MAGYGWSYLTVMHVPDTLVWRTSDSSAFSSEEEMYRELGVTGWELVSIREFKGSIIYTFKRPRA
jgi:hypothetical protein